MNAVENFKNSINNELKNKDYTHFSIDMCSLLEQVCNEYFSELSIDVTEKSLFNKVKKIAEDVAMDNVENFLFLIKDRNNIVHQRISYSTKIDDSSVILIIEDYNKLIGKIRYRHRKILLGYKIETNLLTKSDISYDYNSLYNSILQLKDEVQNLSSKFDGSKLTIEQEVETSSTLESVKEEVLNNNTRKVVQKGTMTSKLRKHKENRRPTLRDDSTFFKIENGVLLKYRGKGKTVVLPKDVKEIGEAAFYCSWKKQLSLSFSNSDSDLEEIDLRGVTKIGKSAFKGCVNLKKVVFDDSLQVIEEKAFYGCEKLKAIEFPDSLTMIERYAFDRCGALKSLILPDSLTYMGLDAFCFCSNLEYVYIGKKLKRQICFSFCNNLRQIDVSIENKYIKSVDGNVYSKDGKTLICYAVGKSNNYIIPEYLQKIEDYSVYGGGGNKIIKFIVHLKNQYFSTINDDLYTADKETLISYCSGKTDKCYLIKESIKKINPLALCNNENLEKIVITRNLSISSHGLRTAHESLLLPWNIKELEIYDTVTDISWINLNSGRNKPSILYHGNAIQWEKVIKPNCYSNEEINQYVIFNELKQK